MKVRERYKSLMSFVPRHHLILRENFWVFRPFLSVDIIYWNWSLSFIFRVQEQITVVRKDKELNEIFLCFLKFQLCRYHQVKTSKVDYWFGLYWRNFYDKWLQLRRTPLLLVILHQMSIRLRHYDFVTVFYWRIVPFLKKFRMIGVRFCSQFWGGSVCSRFFGFFGLIISRDACLLRFYIEFHFACLSQSIGVFEWRSQSIHGCGTWIQIIIYGTWIFYCFAQETAWISQTENILL